MHLPPFFQAVDLRRSRCDARAGAPPPSALSVRDLARLVGAPAEAAPSDTHFAKRYVRTGESLWRQGDRFESLHALGTGTFKIVAVDAHGSEQVLCFARGGEIIGLDGIGGTCISTAVAIAPGWVARVPFADLATLAGRHDSVRRLLNLIFSAEIARRMRAITLLGVARSEARLATFLLQAARHTLARIAPGSAVDLAMSRGELGSHLGLRLETVSRAFGALAAAGLVRVGRRAVILLDPAGLQAIAEGRALRDAGPIRMRRSTPGGNAWRAAPACPPLA